MGLLIDGRWQDQWYDTAASGGRFVRGESGFRHWVTADGAPGPTGEGGFAAEAGRYHLYVSLACPWAHRTLIYRALKGLGGMISVSVVHWRMGEQGWSFEDGPGVVPDPINGAAFLHQVYTAAEPSFTGRVTVPVLWDRKRATIVNNESSEIIRMFDRAFDGLGAKAGDRYPAPLARRDRRVERAHLRRQSTTASTKRVSRRPRPPTRKRSGRSSMRSIGSRTASPSPATCVATSRPKPIGVSSRH
jgi:putative glutathione S-transferase